MGQLDGRRGVEAMPVGGSPGGEAQRLGLDHLVTMQHHQPVGGARELDPRGTPAHVLGHRQAGDRLVQDAGQQGGGGLTLLLLAIAQPGALVGLQVDQLVHADAAGAGEALGGPGRLALLEGRRQGGTALLHLAVGLLVGQCLDAHRQAARRGVGTHRAMGDLGLVQAATQAIGEGVGEGIDGGGGKLLDAQFDQ